MAQQDCTVLASNSYCDFILDIYRDCKIVEVVARRNINKDPNKRGEVKEVLIVCGHYSTYRQTKASYWKNFEKPIPTPVIALELNQVLQLLEHIKLHRITITDIRLLFDNILQLQDTHPHGPAWYKAYSKTYEQWVSTLGSSQD